jgi:uncharacterized RDD family membrane protein YckC
VFRSIVKKVATAPGNLRDGEYADQKTGVDFAIGETSYASFWRRLLGYLIDMGIFVLELIPCVALNIWTDSLSWTKSDSSLFVWIWWAVDWLYQAWMISSRRQATLGMLAAGIYVTDLRGHRLSFWRATARHFAKLLSYYSLIGMFLPLMRKKKQALHDLMTRTVVVIRPRTRVSVRPDSKDRPPVAIKGAAT